jgi:hypothetical protein
MFGHGVSAQTPTPTPPPKPWPTTSPFGDAIDAFTKVLTQAGWDKKLRDEELTFSCDKARDAVRRIGNIKVPDDVIIFFYEGKVIQPPSPTATPIAEPMAMAILKALAMVPIEPRQSEKVHVFVLPPLSPTGQVIPYKYDQYLMCCYQYWR